MVMGCVGGRIKAAQAGPWIKDQSGERPISHCPSRQALSAISTRQPATAAIS